MNRWVYIILAVLLFIVLDVANCLLIPNDVNEVTGFLGGLCYGFGAMFLYVELRDNGYLT